MLPWWSTSLPATLIARRSWRGAAEVARSTTVSFFTGQGSQEPGMGMELYANLGSRIIANITPTTTNHRRVTQILSSFFLFVLLEIFISLIVEFDILKKETINTCIIWTVTLNRPHRIDDVIACPKNVYSL